MYNDGVGGGGRFAGYISFLLISHENDKIITFSWDIKNSGRGVGFN